MQITRMFDQSITTASPSAFLAATSKSPTTHIWSLSPASAGSTSAGVVEASGAISGAISGAGRGAGATLGGSLASGRGAGGA